MDRAAIGLGGVFFTCARLNFYQLFQKEIENFDRFELAKTNALWKPPPGAASARGNCTALAARSRGCGTITSRWRHPLRLV